MSDKLGMTAMQIVFQMTLNSNNIDLSKELKNEFMKLFNEFIHNVLPNKYPTIRNLVLFHRTRKTW